MTLITLIRPQSSIKWLLHLWSKEHLTGKNNLGSNRENRRSNLRFGPVSNGIKAFETQIERLRAIETKDYFLE